MPSQELVVIRACHTLASCELGPRLGGSDAAEGLDQGRPQEAGTAPPEVGLQNGRAKLGPAETTGWVPGWTILPQTGASDCCLHISLPKGEQGSV